MLRGHIAVNTFQRLVPSLAPLRDSFGNSFRELQTKTAQSFCFTPRIRNLTFSSHISVSVFHPHTEHNDPFSMVLHARLQQELGMCFPPKQRKYLLKLGPEYSLRHQELLLVLE